MTAHTHISLPWNFRSEVQHCTTCDGLGRVASQARPTVSDPFPETDCYDCGGREGAEPCAVCGSDLHVPGYDCYVCAFTDELPVEALPEIETVFSAIRAASQAKLLSLTDRRVA